MSFATFRPSAVSQRMAALLPEIFPEPAPLLPPQERLSPASNGLTLGERLLLAILDRVWAIYRASPDPRKVNFVQAWDEAIETVVALVMDRYDRPITVPEWKDTSEAVQAIYGQAALTVLGPLRRFTVTITPTRLRAAQSQGRGPAAALHSVISRALNQAIGRETDCWIMLEQLYDGSCHVHGALAYHGVSERPIRDSLKLLPGVVEVELPQDFAPSIETTCLLLSSKPVNDRRDRMFAGTFDVKDCGRALHEGDVRRLRESELLVLPGPSAPRSRQRPAVH